MISAANGLILVVCIAGWCSTQHGVCQWSTNHVCWVWTDICRPEEAEREVCCEKPTKVTQPSLLSQWVLYEQLSNLHSQVADAHSDIHSFLVLTLYSLPSFVVVRLHVPEYLSSWLSLTVTHLYAHYL